jgi:TonB family protein
VTRQVGGGEWDCTGTIPPAAARARLAEESLQFRNCYERRLKVNHQLEGRVNVQMRVDRTGAVSAVAVGGSMRDGEVLSCVRRIARNIRFPPPQGGSCAVVAVPFNFTPNQ